MNYPQSHPKYAELVALKSEIDADFALIKEEENNARDAYGVAHKSLKLMGDCLKDADAHRTKLVEKLKKLEDIAGEPLI